MVWGTINTMFCCTAKTEEQKESRIIDKQLRLSRRRYDREIKLLLLGAGESGKSTLTKQMKIIHLEGFSEAERQGFKPIIARNVIDSVKILITECQSRGIELGDREAAERVSQIEETVKLLTRSVVADVKLLWADPAIQHMYRNATKFYIMDNFSHYADSIDRVSAENYIPTEDDILKCRQPTSGVYETEFNIQDAHVRMIDVGGQRTERKKWIHYFAGVTAVLFCVSMSEYDQFLYEDDQMLRMHESLDLFRDICRTPWFSETAIILFLNKEDVFKEKITRVPLTVCFPEYTGLDDHSLDLQVFTQDKESVVSVFNTSIFSYYDNRGE